MKNNKLLFIITLSYFLLGLINIHFSLLGLICMTIPLVLLFKNKKKTWCQGYCPRASLFVTTGKFSKSSRTTPKYFTKGNMKWLMLSYFGISLTFILITTLGVAIGNRPPMEYLRYFMVIPIPGPMPQLIEFTNITPWLTHLSYRFYSMMMTTTTLGLALSLVYKPRTWCTICPINTISDSYIKSIKK